MDEQATDLTSPVFVVGPLRSGTTMLRLMLDHHPKLNIFGEFEYAVAAVETGDTWPDRETYLRWLDMDRAFADDRVAVNRSLDYPDLVRSFLAEHAKKQPQKPIIGAAVHSRFDLLPKLWPKARFIHILRDPRDVARSTLQMGWAGHVYYGANYWVGPEQRWEVLTRLPESQRIDVRYENLVRQPVEELTRLCNFLGVEYDAAMMDYDRNTTYAKPDASLIEQWRRKLTAYEIGLVEAVCGDLLERRGYERSDKQATPPGAPERLKLKVMNRMNMTMFAIKRLGPSLWTRRLLAKHIGSETWRRQIKLETNEVERRFLK